MELFIANDKVYARQVELGRIAKKLLALKLAPNQDKALNLTAELLGYRNYHELRQYAKTQADAKTHADDSRNVGSMDVDELMRLLVQEAVSDGAPFPQNLPRYFDEHWKDIAFTLLDEALSKCRPGTLEFVALVGRSGSGKTILSNAHCKVRGGHVIDTDMYEVVQQNLSAVPVESAFYLDRPASTTKAPRRDPLREWLLMPLSERTLKRAKELFRQPNEGLPLDSFGGFDPSRLRQMILRGPVVISFPTVEAVQKAIDEAYFVITHNPSVKHLTNVHVVNLDQLSITTLQREKQPSLFAA